MICFPCNLLSSYFVILPQQDLTGRSFICNGAYLLIYLFVLGIVNKGRTYLTSNLVSYVNTKVLPRLETAIKII